MQTTHLRNKHFVFGAEIILALLIFFPQVIFAQLNIGDRDEKYMTRPFHFGVEMGPNSSNYKITLDSTYVAQSNILQVAGLNSKGFTLGIVSDLHLSRRFDLRFVPDLSFADKILQFSFRNTDTVHRQTVSSVNLEFPFLLKYKSVPYHDMRMYVMAGFKYSYDMQATANQRKATTLVKTVAGDASFEYGLGFEFHLPLVMISPELKISYGVDNVLKEDKLLNYSSVLKRLRTRSFLLCIKFEG